MLMINTKGEVVHLTSMATPNRLVIAPGTVITETLYKDLKFLVKNMEKYEKMVSR